MRIDKELNDLIPPLAEEELAQLEENILKDGVRDSLIVWDAPEGRTIVDGHNRWNIIQRHELPYNIRRMEFKDKDEVKRWIILNQFGRRNINKYQRAELALQLKPLIAEKAKAKEHERKLGVSTFPNSGKCSVHTDKELSKIAKVSHDTIYKVEKINERADEELKEKLRAGEITISKAYQDTVPRKPTKAQRIAEARKEHSEYESTEKDIVDIGEVRKDKSNTEIIARGFFDELSSAVRKIGSVYLSHEAEMKELLGYMSEARIDLLVSEIKIGKDTLNDLEGVIGKWQTEKMQ